ncbi:MAG: hypothetical protein ACJ74Z_09175 [Bryobacteraceae bacterium]|jgi:hypothetical protein
MKTQSKSALYLIGSAVWMSTVLAQSSVDTRKMLIPMAANAKQMMRYEWKQRITVIRKGQPSEPVINQVRFDSNGQMQRTTISAPEQNQMHGLRGRVAAGVKEDVKQIMELAGSYNKPQQMVDAIKKAQISAAPGGTIRVQSNGLIKPTDSMTMLANPTTHLAKHIDINTDYDGDPMTIAQDYSPVPGGPNVMKSMKVSVPGKNLVVKVDSYDFVQQSAGRAIR